MTRYSGREIIKDKHGRPIFEKTPGQTRLVDTINSNDIIFVNGPSGTGKTAIAAWVGINGIDEGRYEHLVLTRPVVPGGEELGFLPGTLDEKIAPYMQPLYDAISIIKDKPKSKTEDEVLKQMPMTAKEKQKLRAAAKASKSGNSEKPTDFFDKVQVCPLAYIRGSTLNKSFIICDEFQNTTIAQMKLMMTRLGDGSKMIICGDATQCDLPKKVTSGFSHAQYILRGIPRIGFVTLGPDDVVRNPLIKEIILRYEVPGYKKNSGVYPGPEDFYKTPAHTWERDREGYDFDEDDVDEDDAEQYLSQPEHEYDDDYCPDCGGTGVDDYEKPCKTCHGSGLVPITK